VPAPVRAIAVKDFLVLRRDLRNLSQLITPLILGIVYGAMLLRNGSEPPAGRGEAPEWFMQVLSNVMVYGNVGISLFVGWSLLAPGDDGVLARGEELLAAEDRPGQHSPAAAGQVPGRLPAGLILGWVFLLAISLLQRAGASTVLYSLAVVALAVAGTTGLNLAFGVAGANLEWSDPRHMQRGASGCLGALFTMAYLLFSLLLFFGPLVLAGLLAWPEVAGQIIGLLAGGATSLACAIAPLWIVAGRVARLGE
jgi:hypothetical protein